MKKDGVYGDYKVSEDGRLLDYMKKELSFLPSGTVKSFLEHRQLSVDGVVTSQFDFPLRKGQTVSVSQPGKNAVFSPIPIVYEDEFLLAVNKPAGLLSVATDTEKERTAFRMVKDSRDGELFVVHRLDRDTSGVLVFAKSAFCKDELQRSWNKIRLREYAAVCEGVFEEKKGRCESYLKETGVQPVYSSSDGDGRLAVTNYEVIKENARYSLVRVTIETGRKNQIRVHMKELGHPVVGDKKYGASGNPLGRLGLHASRLEIIHPVTKNKLLIEAKPERKFALPRV